MENHNKEIKRDKGITTRKGFIFTSKDGKNWQIEYPNEGGRYGSATFDRVAMFFLLLGKGHSIEKADTIAFEKTKIRKRTK